MRVTTTIDSAVVLAAGLGTRMRPITNTIPKPLVSVNGKAMLDHALDALAAADVQQAAVNIHYLPDQIVDHVQTRSQPICHISDERDELLDSGGGVKKAIRLLQNPSQFYILNADSFWIDGALPNLDRMAEDWDSDTMDMMLLVSRKDQAVGFGGKGDFFMDNSGHLTRRGEAQSAPYIYAGAIVAKSSKLHSISDVKFSLNRIFDEAIAENRLVGCVLEGLWLHVGTPQAIAEAEAAIAEYVSSTV